MPRADGGFTVSIPDLPDVFRCRVSDPVDGDVEKIAIAIADTDDGSERRTG